MQLYIFLLYLPFSFLSKQFLPTPPHSSSSSPYNYSPQKTPSELIHEAIHNSPMPEFSKLTNQLPNESNDGLHSFKQIQHILTSRGLTYMEVKSIFQIADLDNGIRGNYF